MILILWSSVQHVKHYITALLRLQILQSVMLVGNRSKSVVPLLITIQSPSSSTIVSCFLVSHFSHNVIVGKAIVQGIWYHWGIVCHFCSQLPWVKAVSLEYMPGYSCSTFLLLCYQLIYFIEHNTGFSFKSKACFETRFPDISDWSIFWPTLLTFENDIHENANFCHCLIVCTESYIDHCVEYNFFKLMTVYMFKCGYLQSMYCTYSSYSSKTFTFAYIL